MTFINGLHINKIKSKLQSWSLVLLFILNNSLGPIFGKVTLLVLMEGFGNTDGPHLYQS